jgi:hypothetical protein
MNMISTATAHSREDEHAPISHLRASIIARLPQLSHDELRVFDVQLDRMLRIGRANYAPLNLSSDQRDWSSEIGEELSDALFYLCARHVAREDAKKERAVCAAADRVWDAMVGADWFGIVQERAELPDAVSSFDCDEDGRIAEVLR